MPLVVDETQNEVGIPGNICRLVRCVSTLSASGDVDGAATMMGQAIYRNKNGIIDGHGHAAASIGASVGTGSLRSCRFAM